MSSEIQDITLNIDTFLPYMSERDFGDIHFKVDRETGLVAIIAIHSTKLGPSLGGCRWLPYDSTADAVYDALRLARGMSYKAALVNIPYGGGKSVIIKPQNIPNKQAYFAKFAEFVNELGGRYITAVDSGTTLKEMDIIVETCPYVASLTRHNGEPSPYTAFGVLHGINAAVRFKMKREDLQGLHVAIQGVGKVGYYLAKELHARGVRLTVADVNNEAVQRCVEEFNAEVASTEQIHAVDCDIYSPCALGAVINDHTIREIKASVVCGAANNVLSRRHHGTMLHERGIAYCPDYVVNSGGLIYATTMYEGKPGDQCLERIAEIEDTLQQIFDRSLEKSLPTNLIADMLAQERLS